MERQYADDQLRGFVLIRGRVSPFATIRIMWLNQLGNWICERFRPSQRITTTKWRMDGFPERLGIQVEPYMREIDHLYLPVTPVALEYHPQSTLHDLEQWFDEATVRPIPANVTFVPGQQPSLRFCLKNAGDFVILDEQRRGGLTTQMLGLVRVCSTTELTSRRGQWEGVASLDWLILDLAASGVVLSVLTDQKTYWSFRWGGGERTMWVVWTASRTVARHLLSSIIRACRSEREVRTITMTKILIFKSIAEASVT